jgi:hypothetical protein
MQNNCETKCEVLKVSGGGVRNVQGEGRDSLNDAVHGYCDFSTFGVYDN